MSTVKNFKLSKCKKMSEISNNVAKSKKRSEDIENLENNIEIVQNLRKC